MMRILLDFQKSILSSSAPREIHPEWFNITPKKKRISILIDIDVLETLKSEGKGYQTRINSILREAVLGHTK